MVALVFDPAIGVIAYSSRRVYEILIREEDRKVSEQYLELDNPNFKLALKYAKKPAQKHKVPTLTVISSSGSAFVISVVHFSDSHVG